MSTLRVRYQTIEFGDTDIHVRSLRDTCEFQDDAGEAERLGISSATWPLFGIVWDSGQVLAHLMFNYDIAGRRVLEVGCGLGLASLVLNHRQADITATDYHPEVEGFLKKNVALNGGADIPFVRAGWHDVERDVLLGDFDLIIGSDLLYDHNHAEQLSRFIDHHARNRCEVLIVDPGRKQRGQFSTRMEAFGYAHHRTKPVGVDYLDEPFRGQILHYTREEAVA